MFFREELLRCCVRCSPRSRWHLEPGRTDLIFTRPVGRDLQGVVRRWDTRGDNQERCVSLGKHSPMATLSAGRTALSLPGSQLWGQFEINNIFLGSLDSGEKRPIVSASSNAAYADPGYLLYIRDNALVAQRFDSRSYELSGEPRTISDEVQYFPQTDLALFGVAGKGTLVVQTGKGADKSQLTWVDRNGKQVGAVAPPGLFANPSLSPDGRRVVFEQTDRDGRHVDIWIHELANDAVARLTFGPGLNERPAWSPDGKRVVFGFESKGFLGHTPEERGWIWGRAADCRLERCATGSLGLSRDGRYLLIWKNGELWYCRCQINTPNHFSKRSGSYATHSFRRMGNGWRIARMRREIGRSMYLHFRARIANGKYPGEAEKNHAGDGTARSCSICLPKGK
jgi:WD40-like Beta Propeller Repeat